MVVTKIQGVFDAQIVQGDSGRDLFVLNLRSIDYLSAQNEISIFQNILSKQSQFRDFNYTFTFNTLGIRVTDIEKFELTLINDDPVAAEDTNSLTEDDASLSGNVLSNDFDLDLEQILRVSNVGVTQGQYGSFEIKADGEYTYTSTTNLQWLDDDKSVFEEFKYLAEDGWGGESFSSIKIIIQGSNDSPIVQKDFKETTEDQTLPISGNVLINDNDPDADDILMVQNSGIHKGNYGWLQLNIDGSYIYNVSNSLVQDLVSGEFKTERFAVLVSDGTAQAQSELEIKILGADDYIYGSSGDDNLEGTDKNDIFISSGGNDTIYSGYGLDKIIYASAMHSHIISNSNGGALVEFYDGTGLIKVDTIHQLEEIEFPDGSIILQTTTPQITRDGSAKNFIESLLVKDRVFQTWSTFDTGPGLGSGSELRSDANTTIWLQLINLDGSTAGPKIKINDLPILATPTHQRIVEVGQGKILICWEGSDYRVEGKLYDFNGKPISATLTLFEPYTWGIEDFSVVSRGDGSFAILGSNRGTRLLSFKEFAVDGVDVYETRSIPNMGTRTSYHYELKLECAENGSYDAFYTRPVLVQKLESWGLANWHYAGVSKIAIDNLGQISPSVELTSSNQQEWHIQRFSTPTSNSSDFTVIAHDVQQGHSLYGSFSTKVTIKNSDGIVVGETYVNSRSYSNNASRPSIEILSDDTLLLAQVIRSGLGVGTLKIHKMDLKGNIVSTSSINNFPFDSQILTYAEVEITPIGPNRVLFTEPVNGTLFITDLSGTPVSWPSDLVVNGDDSDNVINCGAGIQYIDGGLGSDTITGGSGADVFIFKSEANFLMTTDVIKDFNQAEGDKLLLPGMTINSAWIQNNIIYTPEAAVITVSDHQLILLEGVKIVGINDFTVPPPGP